MNQDRSTADRIYHVLSHTLGADLEEISQTTALKEDLNAAPEDIATLIENLEKEFGIEISLEDRRKMTTVGEVINIIKDYIDEFED